MPEVKLTKKHLKLWLIGVHAKTIGLNIEDAFDKEKAEKSVNFSNEVMRFLEEHNLLNKELI